MGLEEEETLLLEEIDARTGANAVTTINGPRGVAYILGGGGGGKAE